MIARFLNDLFTGTNGKHFDWGRVAWALVVLAGIIYQGIALAFKNQPFSVTDFGTGMGLILASGGIGVAAKDLANPANRKAKVTVEGDIQTAEVAGDMNVAGDMK